jgi:hypothetical protein
VKKEGVAEQARLRGLGMGPRLYVAGYASGLRSTGSARIWSVRFEMNGPDGSLLFGGMAVRTGGATRGSGEDSGRQSGRVA